MKKNIINNDVYYALAWSEVQKYDRFTSSRTLPVLPGIIGLFQDKTSRYVPLVYFECWREGLRDGLKNFMLPTPRYKTIRELIDPEELFFNYTVAEGPQKDLKDVLFWLIKTYKPLYNNSESFSDSGRYKNIHVKEIMRSPSDIIEKIP